MKGGFYSNRPRYEERRKQAEARRAAYDKLTPAEKLANLNKNGLRATAERARLAKKLAPVADKGKKTVPVIVAPVATLPAKKSGITEVKAITAQPAFVPTVLSNSRAERRRARKSERGA